MEALLREPPPPALERGGGDSEWVELTTAGGDIDAHLVAGVLHEAGIETRRVTDRGVPGAWLYGGSNPWAPVHVLVRRHERDAAGLVLAELAWDAPAREPSRPHGHGARTFLVWWIVALVAGASLTAIALARTAGSIGRCDLPLICAEQTR